jgi:hypothetical protein
LKIIEKNQNASFTVVDKPENAELIWDEINEKSQPLCTKFYNELIQNNFNLSHKVHFQNSPEIFTKDGKKDICATIFYMINCLQEYSDSSFDLDEIGRYKFTNSYQYRFNCVEQNLVQAEIDAFCLKNKIRPYKRKSRIFISHDIDILYGSFLQDGFWALKKMRIDIILRLILNEILRNPDWRNIDQIIKINNEYDLRSTFFWLVNSTISNAGIKNADYSIRKEKDLVHLVQKFGHSNGLHKSCSAMKINEEIDHSGYDWNVNRYHYLNFSVQSDWPKLSESIIILDCSLGFAENYGFRNSYGMAFQPYDVLNNRPFDFIELPLNVMDTTLNKYMKIERSKSSERVINFFEQNKNNCDLTLLWHNTYFTNYKYKSFLDEYKKILIYICESGIGSITPQQIIKDNKLSW